MTGRTRPLAVLWLAGAVSVACNVLAAEATAVGRAVGAWPPVALLLVVEVLARVEVPGWRRWAAMGGAAVVAAVAGLASFHHMHEVALQAGESALVAVLFPLTVDGLAVVASVALTAPSSTTSTSSTTERDQIASSRFTERDEDRSPEPVPAPVMTDRTPASARPAGLVVLNGAHQLSGQDRPE